VVLVRPRRKINERKRRRSSSSRMTTKGVDDGVCWLLETGSWTKRRETFTVVFLDLGYLRLPRRGFTFLGSGILLG